MSRTESISLLSWASRRSWSAVFLEKLSSGTTLSPGLYFASISSFSLCGFIFSGCAASIISKSDTTVELCLVSRTEARHDGHVKMGASGAGGSGAFFAAVACQSNHSFRQAPQKVCRQSRRVSGLYSSSVHICVSNKIRGQRGQRSCSTSAASGERVKTSCQGREKERLEKGQLLVQVRIENLPSM